MAKRYTTNMVRSIGWIKTLTKVQNIICLSFFALISCILTQCKSSSLSYTNSKVSLYSGDSISYTASFPKKEIKGLLLYLPADPDTIDWKKSPLFEKFSKAGFVVFQPYKRYKGDLYKEADMDEAPQRIHDIVKSTQSFMEKHGIPQNNLTIIGSGEGSRLAISTLDVLPASQIILFNYGWYGDLFEIKQLAEKDSVSAKEVKALEKIYIPYKRIDDILYELENDAVGQYKYGGYPSSRWRSYNVLDVPVRFLNNKTPIYWFDFKESYFPSPENEYMGLIRLEVLNRNIQKDTLVIPDEREDLLKDWSEQIWDKVNRVN